MDPIRNKDKLRIICKKAEGFGVCRQYWGCLSKDDGDGFETSLKKLISASSNSVALIPCRSIRQSWQFLLELNSKRLYRCSGKEKESRCLVFTSSTKREIRQLHQPRLQDVFPTPVKSALGTRLAVVRRSRALTAISDVFTPFAVVVS